MIRLRSLSGVCNQPCTIRGGVVRRAVKDGHSNPAMTWHYTHVGELAAGRAVAALPTVIGEATPELPKRQAAEVLHEIGTIVNSISAKNWRDQKAALLEVLVKVSDSNSCIHS